MAMAEAILLQHISGGREKFKNNPGQKKTREIKSINLEFYLVLAENGKGYPSTIPFHFTSFFTWDF